MSASQRGAQRRAAQQPKLLLVHALDNVPVPTGSLLLGKRNVQGAVLQTHPERRARPPSSMTWSGHWEGGRPWAGGGAPPVVVDGHDGAAVADVLVQLLHPGGHPEVRRRGEVPGVRVHRGVHVDLEVELQQPPEPL